MPSVTKRRKLAMNLAKALITMTCAGLLSLGIAGRVHLIYAQDTGETDPNVGSWRAPGADDAGQSAPEVKKHPLKIKGCWSGSVMDTDDGVGTATFQFHQNSNHK